MGMCTEVGARRRSGSFAKSSISNGVLTGPGEVALDADAGDGELHAKLAGHREHAALGRRCRRSARWRPPSCATKDAVLMIEPLPCSSMIGRTALQRR